MNENRCEPILGVLGGMGALASAEFVRSIYESAPPGPEQSSPIVALYSDPTFPDRTEAFLRGAGEDLRERLLDALARLRRLGASRMVLCCMTLHHLVPDLPREVRDEIIPLPDVIFTRVQQSAARHLLLCSTGSRKLNLFEDHPDWDRSKDRILFPDDGDQTRLHELIFEIKENRGVAAMLAFIESLLSKYRIDSFIAGCSELHIVAKRLNADPTRGKRYGCVDPFAILARDWAEGRFRGIR